MKRVLATVLLLVAVFAGTRALVRSLPGDPLNTLIMESGTSIPPETLRRELGLDRPFIPALIHDLSRAVHGDLGQSLLTRTPIAPLVARRFVKTALLTFLTLMLALSFSLPLGLLAAAKPRSRADRACSIYGSLAAALPTPWLGPMLIVLLAVWIPVFPVSGSPILPALTLALVMSGLWARLIRERVRETLIYGAAQGARARGISEWKVLLKYGLAPASGSLLAYLGTQAGGLLAGAFVTEVIFDWRGLGSLLMDAVLRRDYPVVEAASFLAAATCILGTALGDWAQSRIEERKAGLSS